MSKKVATVMLMVCCVQLLSAQQPCIPIKDIADDLRAFKSGERLTYVMGYKWGVVDTDVAEATLSIDKIDEEPYFLAKLLGHTYKFFDIFFKVRYDFETKFAVSNGKPAYFNRDVLEGKFTKKNQLYFEADNIIKSTVQRRSNPPRDTLLIGKECTFDLLSLIYFSRNIDVSEITPGTELPISFVIDDMTYDIYYRYIGREEKKIQKLGRFKTLKFAVTSVAGDIFTGKEELTIWVTDDDNQIPLLFETPISVGKVSGRLSKYKDIKHPLTSKIK